MLVLDCRGIGSRLLAVGMLVSATKETPIANVTLAMGPFPIPTFSFRRAALIFRIFELVLDFPQFPLNTSLSGFDTPLAYEALAASHAASCCLRSPLGFSQSAFHFILCASLHIDLIQLATSLRTANRNHAYFMRQQEPSCSSPDRSSALTYSVFML